MLGHDDYAPGQENRDIPERGWDQEPGSIPPINSARVEMALRELISDIDYDTHKWLECDEDEGADRYPGLTATFIDYYLNGRPHFS